MRIETTYIRAAGSTDVPVLSGLIRVSFRDVAERFALTLANCPKHPSNRTDEWIENDFARGVAYYIFESDGTPVGCVALEKANPDLCYLERLGVLPQSRRKGFGKALVDHVFYEARALGAKQIGIGIISDDMELKLWYRRIGFVEKETKEFAHLPFLVTFMSYEL
jgi:ribosomal protein S18 acetylase RimI-like enzyme